MRYLLLAFIYTSFNSFLIAQTEGKVVFKMTLESRSSTPSPAMAMMKDMLVTLYFSKTKNKVESNMMGGMVKNTVIGCSETNSTLMLMDISLLGKKIAVENGEDKTNEKPAKAPTFKYMKEKKKIHGYTCARVLMSTEKSVIELWVTDKLKFSGDNPTTRIWKGLKGFPLDVKVINDDMVISLAAKEVKVGSVDTAHFNMAIPNGYQKMTPEEFKEAMGGFKFGN